MMTQQQTPVTIYGIKNCDTMKKALDWLKAREIAFAFHDYKTAGISQDHLSAWCANLGWQQVLNRAGTTFKKLGEAEKADLDEAKAIRLMLASPSMIKRPVLDVNGTLVLGFRPETYEKTFGL
jgi:arsenate reductase (glutaredoxin)